MAKNYYDILGVPKNADDKQIKSVYRRLARKYHPDVNPNDPSSEAKFKEVTEAYEVLSNAEKRKLYDQYGSQWEAAQNFGGTGQQNGGQGFHFQTGGEESFGNIFEHIFGGFSGPRPGESKRAVAEAADIEKVIEVSLEEIATGTKRTLTYQVMDACKTCEGTGYVALRTSRPCPVCNGTGKMRGFFGMNQTCGACHGTGKSNLEKCPSCSGRMTIPATKKVEITIPAGIADGKKLRVPRRGSLGADGKIGDLYVVIKEIPHPKFKRKGDDLETEIHVPFTTALLGGEIKIPGLHSNISMKIPECTQNGQMFKFTHQGLPRSSGGKGNMYAKIHVTLPKKITEHERKLLRELATLETINK